MKLAYLGTSEFAAGVLERVVEAGHAPAVVVTRPDAPAGRGRRLRAPAVARRARELGLDVIQPERVNDEPALLDGGFDTIVVCAFGALIRAPLLDLELLNVHPSLLPRWRGAAPIERAIMAGDAETGVAIMRVTAGLDEGPVCLMERERIEDGDDFGSLSVRLRELASALLVRALDEAPPFVEQEGEPVYAEKVTAADRTLEPATSSAAQLDRTVRALHPHIGARLMLADGAFLGVRRARALDEDPGDAGRLVMACASGALELLEVQPPGGRSMDAADYLRGRG